MLPELEGDKPKSRPGALNTWEKARPFRPE